MKFDFKNGNWSDYIIFGVILFATALVTAWLSSKPEEVSLPSISTETSTSGNASQLEQANLSAVITSAESANETVWPWWLNVLDNEMTDRQGFEYQCSKGVLDQLAYFENETLSGKFTFEKYKVLDLLTSEPRDLDIKSSRYANEFRTNIRLDLAEVGVNFAGHYSIVSVGMTGYPSSNYYLVDRANGKAYIFPYGTFQLDFRKDSNLIIMNPKQVFLGLIKNSQGPEQYCDPRSSWRDNDVGARPFYFLWEDNHLKLLGPTDMAPPINDFWESWFN